MLCALVASNMVKLHVIILNNIHYNVTSYYFLNCIYSIIMHATILYTIYY